MRPISSIAGTAGRRAFVAAAAIAIGSLFASDSLAQQSTLDGPGDSAPIDRWLVGEEGVLPDRGRELAGASWMLVRRDGRDSLRLDSLWADRESPAVVYAHSYVRLPADRTMILTWGGLGGAQAGVWINGRSR